MSKVKFKESLGLPMTQKEFIDTNSNLCPKCRGIHIKYYGCQRLKCTDCNNIWEPIFTLTGYKWCNK